MAEQKVESIPASIKARHMPVTEGILNKTANIMKAAANPVAVLAPAIAKSVAAGKVVKPDLDKEPETDEPAEKTETRVMRLFLKFLNEAAPGVIWQVNKSKASGAYEPVLSQAGILAQKEAARKAQEAKAKLASGLTGMDKLKALQQQKIGESTDAAAIQFKLARLAAKYGKTKKADYRKAAGADLATRTALGGRLSGMAANAALDKAWQKMQTQSKSVRGR
jgi:hypothetical protein